LVASSQMVELSLASNNPSSGNSVLHGMREDETFSQKSVKFVAERRCMLMSMCPRHVGDIKITQDNFLILPTSNLGKYEKLKL
jgi:hypothetical protein